PVDVFVADAFSPDGGSVGTGTLRVEIVAPSPSATGPSVTVRGPNGFMQELGATANLMVPDGGYLVQALSILRTMPVVHLLWQPVISPETAIVSAGQQTRVQVSFAIRPGSGHLWVANNYVSNVAGLSSGQLVNGTDITPDVVLSPPSGVDLSSQSGLAFDG